VLEPTPDILAELGAAKRGRVLVGFAAETDDVAAHAAEKLARKGADLLVANDVSQPDAGFEVDTNRAILLESSGAIETTPLLTKLALADLILDRVAVLLGRGDGPTTQEMR
jgi:phosphopantothenoylcysteine decarboxylase/phosphopantothenate--cysteine ligase